MVCLALVVTCPVLLVSNVTLGARAGGLRPGWPCPAEAGSVRLQSRSSLGGSRSLARPSERRVASIPDDVYQEFSPFRHFDI